MKRFAQLVLALALALAAPHAFAGVVIDRLVASVENVPILQSDWDRAVAFEALQQGRTVTSFTTTERRAVLDRLVDQQLLRLQMGDENTAAPEEHEIQNQLAQIRGSYADAKSDDGWRKVLSGYGLDEATVRDKVARQLQVMRFVDLRLRPEAHVQREDIESYYIHTLVPEVEKRGEKPESLTDVSPKIAEILRQQRMDALLTAWLQDLRDHTDVHWIDSAPSISEPSIAAAEGH